VEYYSYDERFRNEKRPVPEQRFKALVDYAVSRLLKSNVSGSTLADDMTRTRDVSIDTARIAIETALSVANAWRRSENEPLVQEFHLARSRSQENYFYRAACLIDQVSLAQGIPDGRRPTSQRTWPLADGYVLKIDCRHHSGPEKGAVISDESGMVVRAAIISKSCSAQGCEDRWILTIFKKPARVGGENGEDLLDSTLLEWAQARVPRISLEIIELPSLSASDL